MAGYGTFLNLTAGCFLVNFDLRLAGLQSRATDSNECNDISHTEIPRCT